MKYDLLRFDNFCKNNKETKQDILSIKQLNETRIDEKLQSHNIGYIQLAAYIQLGVFAPAFTLSFHDSEISRKTPIAHSLIRQTAQKLKMKC